MRISNFDLIQELATKHSHLRELGLVPGGRLIVTCATDPRAPHSGHDGGVLRAGEHYRNIPETELKAWLADWADVEIEVHADRGDLYATAVKP